MTIPKVFINQSNESEEAAKELKAKAEAKVKAEAGDEAEKSEPKEKKPTAVNQAYTKQKNIKIKAATEKQKTAAAPAKEAAKRCTVSFPGARVVLVTVALVFAATMALRSGSSMPAGAAEVVTIKSFFNWANDQQCGLYDNDDFCAVQEAFETPTCSVRLPHLNPRILTLVLTLIPFNPVEPHLTSMSRPTPCLTTRPSSSDARRRSTQPQRRVSSCAPQPPLKHTHASTTALISNRDTPASILVVWKEG